MNQILTLREKRAKAWDAAKAFLDTKRGTDGLLSAEDVATYEKMEADVVSLGKEIDRLERQANLDRELSQPTTSPITNQPAAGGKAKDGRASDEYTRSFWALMRNKSVSHEVYNALKIGQDDHGGFLAPDEFQRTLLDALQEQNIFRQLAHVITTSSGDRKIPVVASKGTAAWIDEEAAYPESDDTETYDQRRRFLRVFTPKLQGTLVYRNRQIACVVEEAGFTASSRERAPNFFISLLCPSPFFEALDEIREELAMWSPMLFFPLEIPGVGLELGARQPSQIITVDNIGDVACGCHIVFRALGSVTNPELMSLDTGDVLRLNTVMESGEELHVYTHFAGKRVNRVFGTEESNAFSLLDTSSVFLQLEPRRNLLRYNAAENMDLLEVTILYRPKFLGV